MRNSASRAILDSTLYVNEVSSAFISERKKRATAKHTVEKLSLYLMAGEILALFVLEILTAVLHSAPRIFKLLIL